MLILMIGIEVKACEIKLEEYRKLEVINAYIVGEYMFDTSEGFSPSLEDFSIAARSIPKGEEEYVYSILDIPAFGEYRVREVFSGEVSEEESEFPYLDLRYNYRANIRGAKENEYDIFTCKSKAIKVSYTALRTEGEGTYKTGATRYVSVQSTNGISEAKYCITNKETCAPVEEVEIEENPGLMEIEYETQKEEQRICVEVKDATGDTSEVLCDEITVKVDKEKAGIQATEELNTVVEGEPHEAKKLFVVNYSVSGGRENYYYYLEESGEKTKYLLSNLSDLPSGDVEVEIMVRGGNGLVSKEKRVITVKKNKVTYDYKTNGGTRASKEYDEIIYNGRVDLSAIAEKEGYEFVGWNTEANATYGLDYLEIKEDVTLYAIYKKEIKGNFEIYSKDATIPAVSEYKSTSCTIYNKEEKCEIKVPEISAKVGYVALGWSKKAGSKEEEYVGKEKIEIGEETTYYSVTRDKVGISATFNHYVAGNVEKEVKKCYLYNGDTTCEIDATEIKNDPYQGRDFVGFTEDKENIIKEDKIIELTKGKEYYSYYEDTYEIKYVSEGEEESDTAHVYFIMDVSGITSKVEEKKTKELKEKEGYKALGWRSDEETLEETIKENESIKVESDVTYNGIYEREVTLKYTSENGTENIPGSETKKIYYNAGSKKESYAEFEIAEVKEIKRSGYIFSKWKDGETKYDPGMILKTQENKILEAEWIENGCIVNLDYRTNGGIRADKSSITYIHGEEAINISNIKAYKPGWIFIGWGIDKNSTTNPITTYKPGSEEKEVTLYAMYKKTIQVKYKVLDDIAFTLTTGEEETYEIYNNSEGYEITLPKVVKLQDKNEFIGWSKKENQKEAEYKGEEKVIVNENTIFYTVSKNIEPLVSTYIYYDGEERLEEKVECYRYNKKETCITESSVKDKIYKKGLLKGWSTSKEEVKLAEVQEISKNTNYYGVYDKIISVTYKSGIAGITSPVNTYEMKYLVTDASVLEMGAKVVLEEADGISGYTTLGWRKDKTATAQEYLIGNIQTLTEDQTYYAVYKKNIELSYTAMGGEETPATEKKTVYYNSSMENIEVEKEFVLAEKIRRTGYDFVGWLIENKEELKYQPGETIKISKNTKAYAKWTPSKYKVKYDYLTNGGTSVSIENKETAYLSQVDLSATAVKAGYEFVGWNTDANATEGLEEIEMPSKDITLYAIYRKEITVTWKMTDELAGNVEKEKTTCYKYNNNENCQIETGNVIANGSYTALGWTTTKGNIEVEAGNDIFTDVGEDKIYYSVTRKTEPLVGTFYYNVEETIITKKTNCVLYNGATECEIVSPIEPLIYKNTPFEGWSSKTNSYEEATMTIDKDTKYYGYYTHILELAYYDGIAKTLTTYTKPLVYILSNTGEYSDIPSVVVKEPESIEGYKTLGWRRDTEKGEATQKSGETLSFTESLVFYAVYNRTITLSYNANKGESTPEIQTATQYYNAETGCTEHTFNLRDKITRTGYTFTGWTEGSESGTKYEELSEIKINKDTEMYAKWEANDYVLTLDANNGSVSPGSIKVKYDNAYNTYTNLPTPTRAGYTFTGWYTLVNGGTKVGDTTKVETASDHTLYAHWTINTYTVNISIANGSASAGTVSVVYGSTNTITVTPNNGYYLSGVSCTNGYTATGYKVDTTITTAQTITINNNKNASNSVCTVKMQIKTYAATKTVTTYTATKTKVGAGMYNKEQWEGNYYRGYIICSKCGQVVCMHYESYTDPATGKVTITVPSHSCGVSYHCTEDVYTCNSGDSLSGTTCTHTAYTCPNGGTLNTSTKMCVF